MNDNTSAHPYRSFFKFTIIMQAGAWVLFSLADLIFDESHYFRSDDMFSLVFFGLPLASVLLYFVYYDRFRTDRPVKECLLHHLIWLGVTAALGGIIFLLVMYEIWFIPQRSGMLDGLEYGIFPILMGMAFLLTLLGRLGKFIYKRCKKGRSS